MDIHFLFFDTVRRVFKRRVNCFQKLHKNHKGFTIIEVLIAIVILSIGILGIAKMQITAIKANSSAMKFTKATIAAQAQIESLLSTSFANVITGAATTTDGYTVVWHVSPDSGGNTAIKNVKVVVTDPAGKKKADISFIKAADI
ncbi:type IV pilus modification protein PilV [Desulfobacula sp.]|uniref:type IV pilus modification protein PilV n=1 Tax=Desulfobacula sp. TaxID=2593537 RepID=UPI0026104329|nr:type IV pilus modification protein PilV [Desulfobacula sp.]